MATLEADKIKPFDVRTAVWDAMLDADMNYVYWSSLGRRYYGREKVVQIFLALFSSSAVAGWTLLVNVDLLWKTLSALSAGIALALPILNWKERIEVMSTIAGKWFHLKINYESLWLDAQASAPNEIVRQRFEELRKREVDINASASNLPDDRELVDRATAVVLKKHGLKGD